MGIVWWVMWIMVNVAFIGAETHSLSIKQRADFEKIIQNVLEVTVRIFIVTVNRIENLTLLTDMTHTIHVSETMS